MTNDFFINDFTLAELKNLSKVERYKSRNHRLDGLYTYVTLEEVIEQMLDLNKHKPQLKSKSRPTGLYIETKMYEWYKNNRSINIAEETFKVLKKYGLHTVKDSENKIPVIMECFEEGSLRRLANLTDLPLVFLIHEHVPAYVIPKIPEISKFAHAIGPRDVLVKSKLLVAETRAYGLAIHPWYVRDDFLDLTKDVFSENLFYYKNGFEGIFTEFPHMTLNVFLHASKFNKTSHFMQEDL